MPQYKMSENVDLKKWRSDVKFGSKNQKATLPYLDEYFSKLLEKKVQVKEFSNCSSRFDYYIPNENIFIELKSRRCSINKYPTQLVNLSKVKSGRRRMIKNNRVFYFFLLKNEDTNNVMDLFAMEDNFNRKYEVRELGNFFRNDKPNKCCVIDNDYLDYITSFYLS